MAGGLYPLTLFTVHRMLYVSQWLSAHMTDKAVQGLATPANGVYSDAPQSNGPGEHATKMEDFLEEWELGWMAACVFEQSGYFNGLAHDVGRLDRPGEPVLPGKSNTMELDLLGLLLPQGVQSSWSYPNTITDC